MDVVKTQQISSRPIDKVIVHPLVLLSIVDNYNRVARDTRKRVIGVLLGTSFKGTVDVTNSYAGLISSSISFFSPYKSFIVSLMQLSISSSEKRLDLWGSDLGFLRYYVNQRCVFDFGVLGF